MKGMAVSVRGHMQQHFTKVGEAPFVSKLYDADGVRKNVAPFESNLARFSAYILYLTFKSTYL